MIILESFSSLVLLLGFFCVLGMGVTNLKTAKNDFALLPIFGYSAVIVLSYFISANFKISGASAVGWAILILLCSFLLRIKSFSTFLQDLYKSRNLYMFLAVAAIPICTLILPALLIGFKYFFGYVNFDFFYNSQDSWYLMTHHVLQLTQTDKAIYPLNWSANFSGRVGVGLLGAFFSKTLNLDVLYFNSLLLNVIVVMFALSLSTLCREFFKLSNKAILVAVFFSVMSAGYVQAYCYYVFGQISVIPVFVVYCIFLKRFIDSVRDQNNQKTIISYGVIIGLLLNVLFVIYAILSVFAALLTVISYFLCLYNQITKRSVFQLLSVIFFSIMLFCVMRIWIVPESISIFKSWLFLSSRVAQGHHGVGVFLVFSEYLTESLLSLFFGLANYVTSNSIFYFLHIGLFAKNVIFFVGGLTALWITFIALKQFAFSKNDSKSAGAIIVSLFGIIFVLACYFFYTLSGYGLFKLQTWFMPMLTPLYIYFIIHLKSVKFKPFLMVGCSSILVLNLIASMIYFSDFLTSNTNKHFVSAYGVTGNKDLLDVAAELHSKGVDSVSLFLTNGLESAWILDFLRNIKIDKIAHNTQPLIEKEYSENSCAAYQDTHWIPSGLLILNNPDAIHQSDIVDSPVGGTIVYKNASYVILDPKQLQTLVFIGDGSFPVEYMPKVQNSFPSKFRWSEKGLQVMVYSYKDRLTNFAVEITPGFVDNSLDHGRRHVIVKTSDNHYLFSIESKTVLKIANMRLHKGLNCIAIESPDSISRLPRYGAFIRSSIPLDPRVTNFAISNIVLS